MSSEIVCVIGASNIFNCVSKIRAKFPHPLKITRVEIAPELEATEGKEGKTFIFDIDKFILTAQSEVKSEYKVGNLAFEHNLNSFFV